MVFGPLSRMQACACARLGSSLTRVASYILCGSETLSHSLSLPRSIPSRLDQRARAARASTTVCARLAQPSISVSTISVERRLSSWGDLRLPLTDLASKLRRHGKIGKVQPGSRQANLIYNCLITRCDLLPSSNMYSLSWLPPATTVSFSGVWLAYARTFLPFTIPGPGQEPFFCIIF